MKRSFIPYPSSFILFFSRLGDALTLGGLASLVWMFALQLQTVVGGTAAGAAPVPLTEPGITIPPTSIRPPSPWLPALPWIAAALLVVGILFVLTRRSLWPTLAGALVAALLLTGFIPPLSALPNPLGLYWRLAGGYGYDPHLPFKNNFLIAGRPENELRPYLDALIGQVGLSPLDPVQPLARYEILRVSLHPKKNRTALVSTRFIYADGSSRVYPVPLLGPRVDLGGFWLAAWRADGLQRLRSEHLALPGQPFATSDSPIRVSPARRLDLSPAASRLDEVNPGHWLWNSVRVQRLVWAPDGSAFLAAEESDTALRQLWLVPLDGSAPTAIGPAGDVREYGWSPDSHTVIFTRLDSNALAVDPTRPYAVSAFSRVARGQVSTLVTGLETDKLPGLDSRGAWFFSNGSVWIAPYDGAPAVLLIPDLLPADPVLPPRPSPDGTRAAYACEEGVCVLALTPLSHSVLFRMGEGSGVRVSDLAWSRDGSMLAVIDRDPNNLRPVRLVILANDGAERLARDIAPGEATDSPQWTPDGGAVFVQTFPQDGRRIIALDLASGQVLDLSQEHWDAYFALSPDGQTLLLNNGRGDWWAADVLRE